MVGRNIMLQENHTLKIRDAWGLPSVNIIVNGSVVNASIKGGIKNETEKIVN
jgi:hypothetical protein